MDPDESLDETRDLTEHLRDMIEHEDHGFTEDDVEKTDRLVDLVKAQDEWIMKGGFLPAEWALRCNGGLLARAELAKGVYEDALAASETFEGDFGMQLAYLFGAILKGTSITLDCAVAEEAEVLELLEGIFQKNHPVWVYIQVANRFSVAS